jgi:hypothetical protein
MRECGIKRLDQDAASWPSDSSWSWAVGRASLTIFSFLIWRHAIYLLMPSEGAVCSPSPFHARIFSRGEKIRRFRNSSKARINPSDPVGSEIHFTRFTLHTFNQEFFQPWCSRLSFRCSAWQSAYCRSMALPRLRKPLVSHQ